MGRNTFIEFKTIHVYVYYFYFTPCASVLEYRFFKQLMINNFKKNNATNKNIIIYT